MSLSVLHVAQPVTGGVAAYVLPLLQDQARQGREVALACPPDGTLPARAKEAGIAVVPWPASRNPGPQTLLETARLARVVSGTNPDVVHLHSSKAGLAGRLALRGRRPTIFQPHGWSFEVPTGALRRVVVAWERLAARWADALVCVSQGEAERGAAAGIDARWAVIATGIDLAAFPPADDDARVAARRRLGLGGAPLVVCVGRLSRAKGQDVLLDAWPLVRAAVPEAGLVLVGDGPTRAGLERRAVAGTTFAGERPDVSDWLAAADVAVMPSRWEGMSLGLLEAMATSRSVVATDVAGAREALGQNSSAIVPVEDRVALADALARRLQDPALARAEGEASRRRAEAAYDFAWTTKAFTELYEDVVRRRAETGTPT
jgi:glycosyltransferase involved in cell wall biosynthesis